MYAAGTVPITRHLYQVSTIPITRTKRPALPDAAHMHGCIGDVEADPPVVSSIRPASMRGAEVVDGKLSFGYIRFAGGKGNHESHRERE
jgi:hypothetical protein